MTIKQHGGVFGRNPSFNDVSVKTLSIAGTALSSTAAELNILDGVTADATEINYLDGASTSVVTASKAVLANASANIAFASGKGLDFSATSDAGGMTSELFDDYEEGTWTPANGANLAVVGTATRSGEYVKIGNTVIAWGSVTATTSVSYTAGGQILSGLPYAAQGIAAAGSIFNASNAASAIQSLPTTNFIYGTEAVGASTGIFFQLTYHV